MPWESGMDAACVSIYAKYVRAGRKDGEKRAVLYLVLRLEIKAKPSRITPAKLLLCEWRYNISVGWEDFYFFVRYENAANCVNAQRHAGSRQLQGDLPYVMDL